MPLRDGLEAESWYHNRRLGRVPRQQNGIEQYIYTPVRYRPNVNQPDEQNIVSDHETLAEAK